MKEVNWELLLSRLRAYPAGMNRIVAPLPPKRIAAVQAGLGVLPKEIAEMLRHMNGAELFIDALPFITLFGISPEKPVSPLQWAADWYIDVFTPKWRSFSNRPDDWVIAMSSDGVLVALDSIGISEWDTAAKQFTSQGRNFADWIETVLREGEAYLKSD